MDGCVYHPKYLKTLFAQVSAKMTEFIALKLGIDKINAHEFLKFVHTINYDCLEKDVELREELLKLDVKAYCATNGSREHAMNCMKKIGIDDLFEGKVMDIVDFNLSLIHI